MSSAPRGFWGHIIHTCSQCFLRLHSHDHLLQQAQEKLTVPGSSPANLAPHVGKYCGLLLLLHSCNSRSNWQITSSPLTSSIQHLLQMRHGDILLQPATSSSADSNNSSLKEELQPADATLVLCDPCPKDEVLHARWVSSR